MNQLLENIKLWFLGVFDNAVAFCQEKWEEQRFVCIAVIVAFLLIMLLLLLIPVLVRDPSAQLLDPSLKIQEVEIEPFLSIPSEPTIEDDYLYSRKKVNRWSDESVDKWFSEPDESMLDDLKKANNKLVEDMMEVVP